VRQASLLCAALIQAPWRRGPRKRRHRTRSFRQLYHLNLHTSRVWWLKETFGGFRQYCYAGTARKFFGDWLAQVTHSGLTPMKKVAAMFVRHLPGLLNYLKHRISNAASEGINSQPARIIANARGISCSENLRTRVLFFLDKLNLSPA